MEATYRNSGKIGLISLILFGIVLLFSFRDSPLYQLWDTPIIYLIIIILLIGIILFIKSVLLLVEAKPINRTANMGKVEWALNCGKKVAVGLALICIGKIMIIYKDPLYFYFGWGFDDIGNILIIIAWLINIISASIFLSGLRVMSCLKILAASIILFVVGLLGLSHDFMGTEISMLSLMAGLLLFLFAIGTMFSMTQESVAISRIRNAVALKGFAPNEAEEIILNVEGILKAGKYKHLDGSESLVQAVADISTSPAEWTKFTDDELVSVIEYVAQDRKKSM